MIMHALAARATVAASSSAVCGWYEPTAFTWAPVLIKPNTEAALCDQA